MNSRRIWKAVGGVLMAAIFMVACAAPTATPAVPQATQTPQIIQQTVQVEVTRVVQVEGPTQTAVSPVPTVAPVEEPIRLITPGKLTVGIFPAPGADEIIDGKITGVEGLLIAEIAKRLNLQPEYQPYDKPSAIAALLSGRVDVLAAGLSVQPPRAQVVYFAEPWLLQAEGISVLPGTEIHSWEEAAAKKETLATVTGYSYIPYWEQLGVNIHTFDSIDACFLDVINKGATGCAVGTFDLMYRKATAPESAISKLVAQPVSGPSIFADLNSLAVAKDNPALARKVSQLMVDLWRDGTVEKDYRQIFGNTEIELFINPPKGSALYYPGPWEADIVAPASPVYPAATTLAPGQLTVGILSNSNLLKLDGANVSGPEAKILQFAAEKLGLQVKAVAITDPAAALNGGKVDVVAGALPATEADSHVFWQSKPIGFNPDYIYVLPAVGGQFTSWEDVQKAKGKLAVISGSPRIADLKAAGIDYIEVPDAATGLKAVVDKSVMGLVAATPEFNAAVSADQSLVNAGIGWVRNTDLYTLGQAYVWGVKAGNGSLLDGLNQAIIAAWQQKVNAEAYRTAFPGANVTSLLAPGPTAIGSSFSSAKDYLLRGIWLPGPWLQRPGWVK